MWRMGRGKAPGRYKVLALNLHHIGPNSVLRPCYPYSSNNLTTRKKFLKTTYIPTLLYLTPLQSVTYRVYVAPRTYIEHTFVTARSAADTAQCVVPTVRWLVGNSSPLTFVFCQNTSCIPPEYTLYIAAFFLYTALFFRQIRPFLP